MGKAVQNPLPPAESADGGSVALLVQEESRLLAIFHIHHVLHAVFHNLHLCVKRFSHKALASLHTLLQTHLGVAPLIYPADDNALLGQHFLHRLHNDLLPSVDPQGQGLHHQHIGKLVHHNPRQKIRLPKDQTAAGSVHRLPAVLPGIPDTLLQKRLVYHRILLPGEHAHGNPGPGIEKAASHAVAVKIPDGYHIPLLKIPCNGVYLIVVYPHTSRFQSPSLTFFQFYNRLIHCSPPNAGMKQPPIPAFFNFFNILFVFPLTICPFLFIIRAGKRCVAQLGRALRSGRRGRRFESCRIDSLAEVPEALILEGFWSFFVPGNGCLESGEKGCFPTKFQQSVR